MVCWFIWTERNNYIFENRPPSTTSIAYKSLGLYHTWNAIHPRAMGKSIKHMPPTPEKTPIGWFDGASQSNGMQSGAGGVLHITTNTHCRWTYNCGQGSNTRAELLGTWASLLLASRLNITSLHLYGDSHIVIDWLNNKNKLQVVSLFGWKARIRHLQSFFNMLSFKHIYRDSNKEVDSLSKTALKMQPGTINYNIWVDGQEGPTLALKLF
jgi:ribonuclease HI